MVVHDGLGEDQEFNSRFGEQVRIRRVSEQLSQRRLAEKLEEVGVKLDQSAVTRIERGTREVKLREAVAIAAALGADLRELTRVDKRPRDELEALLGSVTERRKAARSALGGMAFYYVMAIRMLADNPNLLEELRVEAHLPAPIDIADFLRLQAAVVGDFAAPVCQLAVTDEENALIEAIITASARNITAPMTDEDHEFEDDGDDVDDPDT